MRITRHTVRAVLALGAVLATTSCRTIQYREVQSDFERAVQAENARDNSPFINWYQGVASTLTDDFIGKLDEKLQPNAWMLRGMAEWRSGSYSNASVSAAKGSREIGRQMKTAPNLGNSRDAIVLTMLPGLLQDSQLRDTLHSLMPVTNLTRKTETNPTNSKVTILLVTNVTESSLTADVYQTNLIKQFAAVLQQFAEARKLFAEPTPEAVKIYWNYHVWRALENWNWTIAKLKLPAGTDRLPFYVEAGGIIARRFSNLTTETNLKTELILKSAIQAAKLAIPPEHPYRRLIEVEEKQ